MQLISRVQNNRRQQHIEKDLVIKVDQTLQILTRRQPDDEADNHARKDGNHGLMDGLDFLELQVVGTKQCQHNEHDLDEERPRRYAFGFFGVGGLIRVWFLGIALWCGRERESVSHALSITIYIP